MGTLTYDSKVTASIDDRILAHLQVVILAKLRRGEPFAFTWKENANGLGRTTIWIHNAISLTFQYYGGKTPQLNSRWIQALVRSSNSVGGLEIVPEPPAAPLPAAEPAL
ncbi:MAG: ATP-dependent ligase [Mycetocola sp.]|nr:ATP-dependent DNA ligase [Mycetocola sp.]MCU1419091.1 ATP-dependent ligase [Mycetocola sp.]MCU1560041.1 ATP-dependent ligase [Mycetocola sp.]